MSMHPSTNQKAWPSDSHNSDSNNCSSADLSGINSLLSAIKSDQLKTLCFHPQQHQHQQQAFPSSSSTTNDQKTPAEVANISRTNSAYTNSSGAIPFPSPTELPSVSTRNCSNDNNNKAMVVPKSPSSTRSHAVIVPALTDLSSIFDRVEGQNIPNYVRLNDSTLSFPEKLMLMLMHIEREYAKAGKRNENAPVVWTLDGRAFVIRQREPLISHWLPLFFRQSKFSSFTRKLYRWGFRQVNMPRDVIQQDYRELVFGNANFQRDSKHLLKQMASVTAASNRKREETSVKEQNGGPMTQAVQQKDLNLTYRPATIVSLPPENPLLAALDAMTASGNNTSKNRNNNTNNNMNKPMTQQLNAPTPKSQQNIGPIGIAAAIRALQKPDQEAMMLQRLLAEALDAKQEGPQTGNPAPQSPQAQQSFQGNAEYNLHSTQTQKPQQQSFSQTPAPQHQEPASNININKNGGSLLNEICSMPQQQQALLCTFLKAPDLLASLARTNSNNPLVSPQVPFGISAPQQQQAPPVAAPQQTSFGGNGRQSQNALLQALSQALSVKPVAAPQLPQISEMLQSYANSTNNNNSNNNSVMVLNEAQQQLRQQSPPPPMPSHAGQNQDALLESLYKLLTTSPQQQQPQGAVLSSDATNRCFTSS